MWCLYVSRKIVRVFLWKLTVEVNKNAWVAAVSFAGRVVAPAFSAKTDSCQSSLNKKFWFNQCLTERTERLIDGYRQWYVSPCIAPSNRMKPNISHLNRSVMFDLDYSEHHKNCPIYRRNKYTHYTGCLNNKWLPTVFHQHISITTGNFDANFLQQYCRHLCIT